MEMLSQGRKKSIQKRKEKLLPYKSSQFFEFFSQKNE